MAAYAATVTIVGNYAKKLVGYPGMGLLHGKVNITNYNSVAAEITGITSRFKASTTGFLTVVCSGVSDGAVKQLVRWSPADKAFKCYVPTTGAETANDVNVGSVDFFAIGSVT